MSWQIYLLSSYKFNWIHKLLKANFAVFASLKSPNPFFHYIFYKNLTLLSEINKMQISKDGREKKISSSLNYINQPNGVERKIAKENIWDVKDCAEETNYETHEAIINSYLYSDTFSYLFSMGIMWESNQERWATVPENPFKINLNSFKIF